MKMVGLTYLLLLVSLMSVGSVAAHVQLDYPVGGETFEADEIIRIEWQILISHNQENWDLYFSPDGGQNWEVIQLDMNIAKLNYQWTVPQISTENAQIRIVQDNTSRDYVDISGDFTIQETSTSVQDLKENPKTFKLHANYPNPFNPSTTINYSIPEKSNVKLVIYNMVGELVTELVDKEQEIGYYELKYNASNMSSGIYFYRLQVHKSGRTGDPTSRARQVFVETKKMIFLQ